MHEFISEAFTNPEFQSLLRNLPTEGKTPTIFKQFLDAVAKFFGTKDASILNDIFHHTENLREQSIKEQPKSDIDAKKEAIETEKQQAITEATKPVVDLELLGDETQTIDLITEKASGDKDGGKAKIRQHERIRARLQALKDLIDCV